MQLISQTVLPNETEVIKRPFTGDLTLSTEFDGWITVVGQSFADTFPKTSSEEKEMG